MLYEVNKPDGSGKERHIIQECQIGISIIIDGTTQDEIDQIKRSVIGAINNVICCAGTELIDSRVRFTDPDPRTMQNASINPLVAEFERRSQDLLNATAKDLERLEQVRNAISSAKQTDKKPEKIHSDPYTSTVKPVVHDEQQRGKPAEEEKKDKPWKEWPANQQPPWNEKNPEEDKPF